MSPSKRRLLGWPTEGDACQCSRCECLRNVFPRFYRCSGSNELGQTGVLE